jgi:hypothetical protein
LELRNTYRPGWDVRPLDSGYLQHLAGEQGGVEVNAACVCDGFGHDTIRPPDARERVASDDDMLAQEISSDRDGRRRAERVGRRG